MVSLQIPGVTLAKILTLDSTSFMEGHLMDDVRPRFSLQTRVNGFGPSTTINSYNDTAVDTNSRVPQVAATNEVGLVEWRSSAIGRPKTIVKALALGKTLTMRSKNFGAKRYFGGLGGQDVRWQETNGTWECTSTQEPRVLAILHSRIATRGTRIEVSSDGAGQMDTIVLTALLVLHGEHDWKAFTNRNPSPYSLYQPRLNLPPLPHITAITLTLSTNSFLNGLLAVGGQLMYSMRTVGNKTTISKYAFEERARLEEFATIEWHSATLFGKMRSILSYKGQKNSLEDFMYAAFLGNRMRRFGMPEFLPWLQWIERPPSWSCVSHPARSPLAILERRFMTAGTRLDVTMEGLEYLDAIVLSCIFVVHSPVDWRRPENLRNNTAPALASNDQSSARHLQRLQRIANLRGSASMASVHRADSTQYPPPPGLPHYTSGSGISRLSGVSGESDIPAYSPPPRGLILNYNEDGYMDPRPTPLASAAASGINLAQFAQFVNVLGSSRLAAAETAHIEEVHDPPPPSYHPPDYESS